MCKGGGIWLLSLSMHVDPEFWAPSFLPNCCRALWAPGEKSHSKCSSSSLSNSGSVHTGICNNYVIKTLLFIWHLIKSDFQWHTNPWKENDFKRRLRMCDKLRGAMKVTVKDLAWCALLPPCYPFLPFIYTWAGTSRDKPGNPPCTEPWLQ